ncbi:MAG: hypothetical protein AB7F86_11925 [Bdellovibrionales bacterium]
MKKFLLTAMFTSLWMASAHARHLDCEITRTEQGRAHSHSDMITIELDRSHPRDWPRQKGEISSRLIPMGTIVTYEFEERGRHDRRMRLSLWTQAEDNREVVAQDHTYSRGYDYPDPVLNQFVVGRFDFDVQCSIWE